MNKRMDGTQIAEQIRNSLKDEIRSYQTPPHLTVIKVGDDPASEIYVKGKEKACQAIGIDFTLRSYPNMLTQAELIAIIKEENENMNTHGILVQLPLPKHLDEECILEHIDPKKDVDGLHNDNIGKLVQGKDAFIPCTSKGVMELLNAYGISLTGKHVVIVGRSNLVSKPLFQLCLQQDATVTMCHSKTIDLSFYTKQADILIVAVGKKHIIGKDMIKKDAVLIDVGINRVDGRLYGDINSNLLWDECSLYTPVPGGVGPMTIAMLLSNVLKAYKEQG